MIVHDCALPVKQVRIDTYYICLMLVLVIPRLKFRFLFLIDTSYWSWCCYDCLQINCVTQSLKNSKVFWYGALVEAEDAEDSGNCMSPTLKMPYRKWEGSLFTSAILHSFTLVKVKEVCLTGWTSYHLVKYYYSHLKMLCEDKNLHYCSCQ